MCAKNRWYVSHRCVSASGSKNYHIQPTNTKKCRIKVLWWYKNLEYPTDPYICEGMCPEEERYTSHCHLSAAALNNHPVQPKNYKKMDFQGGRGRQKYAQVFLFVICYVYLHVYTL